MQELHIVGTKAPRSDAYAKVTGKAKYTPDLDLPKGTLVAKALWPKYPHALIKKLDVSKAKEYPGVETVMTVKDLPGRNSYGPMVPDKPVIADGKVCYEGDPVCLIAAVDEETAVEALILVEFEYEELPAYDDPREAFKEDAVLIHPNHPNAERGNLLTTVRVDTGNVEEAFKTCDIIIENDYVTPMVDHCYFEQDICIAIPDPTNGGMTLISPNQAVFQGRRTLAGVLGIPQAKINCKCGYVGAGFGGKEDSPLDVSAVAGVLAVKTGKPVVFRLNREEVFRTTGKRHQCYIHHKLGAMKDGTIVACDAVTYLNKGAYVSMGGVAPAAFGVTMRTAIYVAGTYYCPNARACSYSVFTNAPYGNAFRGFGVPQATFAMECQMEELAKALGRDPVDLRRQNMLKHGDKMVTGTYASKYRGLGLGECFDAIEKEMTFSGKYDHGTGKKRRGRGIGAFMYGTGIPLLFEASSVVMTLNNDGSCQLAYSSTEMGQGIATTGAMMCAETLGMKLSDIQVTFSDTQTSPDSGPTVGSRSCTIVGNAIVDGATRLRERMKKVAAQLIGHGCDPRDLDVADSKFFYKANPNEFVTYAAVIQKAYMTQVPLSEIGNWAPPHPGINQPWGQGNTMHAFAFGAQGVELEVDIETGEITLLKSVYAVDIGKAINPQIVEGQIEGASVQAFGWGIMEEQYMKNGRMENPSFHNFLIPTSLDIPKYHHSIIVECANELGPFGAKGIGEPGIIPAAPAIRNAFWDATGIKVNEIPLNPVRVTAAIEQARKEGKEI